MFSSWSLLYIPILVQLPQLPLPGCEAHQLFSSSYWRCYVQQITLTMYHPVGTCKMAADRTGIYPTCVKSVSPNR